MLNDPRTRMIHHLRHDLVTSLHPGWDLSADRKFAFVSAASAIGFRMWVRSSWFNDQSNVHVLVVQIARTKKIDRRQMRTSWCNSLYLLSALSPTSLCVQDVCSIHTPNPCSPAFFREATGFLPSRSTIPATDQASRRMYFTPHPSRTSQSCSIIRKWISSSLLRLSRSPQ